MFLSIPYDVVLLITTFLDTKTFCSIRRVYRIDWYTKKIKQHSKTILEKIESENTKIPKYGETLNFQNKIKVLCTHCNHKAIKFIVWSSAHKRLYIPWCSLHVSGPIMDCVECYSL